MKVTPRQPLGMLSLVMLFTLGCTVGRNSEPVTLSTTPEPAQKMSAADRPASTAQPAIAQAMAKDQQVLATGRLVDGEHPTSGEVQVIQQGNERSLALGADFKTSSMGPDLVVILHRLPDVIGSTVPPAYPLKEGDYVVLSPLKTFTGAQRYSIPAQINLADYPSAAIWCRRFNATFGAARLEAVRS